MYGYSDTDPFETFFIILFIVVVIIFLLTSCGHTIDRNSNERKVVGTVTEKTVKRSGDEQDKYLIFVEIEGEDEVQVFEITDNWAEGKLNSSTIYGNIKVEETYTFTIKGSRNEMLSWYPNISKVEKQKKE